MAMWVARGWRSWCLALALLSVQAGLVELRHLLVLAAVFVTDATVTLRTRLLRGERWYEAHRNHAHQNSHAVGRAPARHVACCRHQRFGWPHGCVATGFRFSTAHPSWRVSQCSAMLQRNRTDLFNVHLPECALLLAEFDRASFAQRACSSSK